LGESGLSTNSILTANWVRVCVRRAGAVGIVLARTDVSLAGLGPCWVVRLAAWWWWTFGSWRPFTRIVSVFRAGPRVDDGGFHLQQISGTPAPMAVRPDHSRSNAGQQRSRGTSGARTISPEMEKFPFKVLPFRNLSTGYVWLVLGIPAVPAFLQFSGARLCRRGQPQHLRNKRRIE